MTADPAEANSQRNENGSERAAFFNRRKISGRNTVPPVESIIWDDMDHPESEVFFLHAYYTEFSE